MASIQRFPEVIRSTGRAQQLPRRRAIAVVCLFALVGADESSQASPPSEMPSSAAKLSTFQLAVHSLVRNIPPGKVATYGEVARAAGSAGGARAVGGTMRNNPMAPGSGCKPSAETP